MFFVLDPLVAITNAIATHALYRGLLWSLVILLPTLFLGRFFCGWICPMGTLQHFVGNSHSEAKRGKQRIESNRYKRWQTIKYVVLIAGLVAAFFGSMVIGTLDPFSLLVRSIGLALLPAFNFASRAVLVPMEHSHVAAIRTKRRMAALDPAGHSSRFSTGALRTESGAGLVVPRHPLGQHAHHAFLVPGDLPIGSAARCGFALVSSWSAQGRVELRQMQSLPAELPGRRRSHRRCAVAKVRVPDVHELCGQLPAWESCSFSFFRKEREVASPDLGRRRTLTGLAVGAAAVPLMRANTGLGKSRHDELLRPPGSVDETDFLSRCIRCGECMKVCPNNSLHPTLTEAGLEGLWTPTLVPRIGYCEPSCVLCSEVCPTGAIWQITPKDKGWVVGVGGRQNQPVRLGTAFYDRGRCLPWALATDCIVCEEWCPVSPKAIYVEEAQVIDSAGNTKTVKQPRVDPSRCVGCGACEYACPLQERPAVYVTSIGESRSPSSQILLNRS